MKTTTKKLSDTKVELKVVLDKKDLKVAHEKAVERLAADVKIQGFRKGKAPLNIAEKALDINDINNTAADIAVRTTVPAAFVDANLNPIVIPNVNVIKYVPGDTLEYIATAEVLPEVKLGDFKHLGVKKQVAKASEKDVKDILDNIQNAYAEKKVAKKKAAMGDEVIIDFTDKKDGVAFDGGSAKDHHLQLGSKSFIPGFEEGLVGHESGDKFDLPLTFPKDYHVKDLAGAKTVFEVLVKQVNEVIKPKLDDELAKKCGPFKTIDDLKADIKKNLEAQNEAKAVDKFKDELVTALVNSSKVAAPEILISDQLRFIKDDVTRNAASHGLQFEEFLAQAGQTPEEWEKEARKVAETRVKASLCLQILARDEKITVPDADVEAKIAELRDVYQKSPEALKNLKDERVKMDIKNRLIIEKTIDYLVNLNSK
ncbi:trigger factor [Candidatus Saccharibacteria bacterium]|nr:trigger factor [Candidatus Saccharibacteria bacterium]